MTKKAALIKQQNKYFSWFFFNLFYHLFYLRGTETFLPVDKYTQDFVLIYLLIDQIKSINNADKSFPIHSTFLFCWDCVTLWEKSINTVLWFTCEIFSGDSMLIVVILVLVRRVSGACLQSTGWATSMFTSWPARGSTSSVWSWRTGTATRPSHCMTASKLAARNKTTGTTQWPVNNLDLCLGIFKWGTVVYIFAPHETEVYEYPHNCEMLARLLGT